MLAIIAGQVAPMIENFADATISPGRSAPRHCGALPA
jgi:hypothetical protein